MNVHSPREHTSDVLIVGAGPLGWACAQLLAREKISTILIDPNLSHGELAWATQGLGVFWPSLNDPPTRAVVAHGDAMGRWLQDYCRQGLNLVSDFLTSDSVREIDCVRVGWLNHEIEELKTAHELGLGLQEPIVHPQVSVFSEASRALLCSEGPHAKAVPNQNKFLNKHAAEVQRIDEMQDHCLTQLSSGEYIRSEMVILANGYKITHLQPWLKNMLIPMSDVESVWITDFNCTEDAQPLAVRASSGHVAAVFIPMKNSLGQHIWIIKMTGPRFMLPSAGAGVDLSDKPVESTLTDSIERWLKTQFLPAIQPVLGFSALEKAAIQLHSCRLAVDCLPCDELPMLGDLGQQGRLLGSTGWLGCGWSASMQTASILCEIVEQGRSARLAPLLRPRRWRSGWDESGVTGMT